MAFKPFRLIRKQRNLIRHFAQGSDSTLKISENKGDVPFKDHSWKVMFFGTDEFSLGSLSRLNEELKSKCTISKLEVVSSKWHLNPVRLYGEKEGLTVHEWPIEPHQIQNCDIGLVASFGHLIPKCIIDAFPLGMLNVHGSLLPRWRGAAPVNYAIMHGDVVTGVSIMRIRPYTFDKGEVISKRKVAITPTDTALELRARLSEVGAKELISCLQRLPQCLENAQPQPEDGVSYAPKITPNLGVVSFKTMSAQCIYNRYRALYGVVPVVTTWMGMRLSLHDVLLHEVLCDSQSVLAEPSCYVDSLAPSLFSPSENGIPGQIKLDKKNKVLVVQCSDNSHLIVRHLAPYKRKPMSAIEFYNGYLSKQSKICWLFT